MGPDREKGGEKEAWHGNFDGNHPRREGLEVHSAAPFLGRLEGHRISRATGALLACCCHKQESFHRAVNCVNSQQAKTLLTAPTPNLQHSPFLSLQRALSLNSQPCCSNILLYWGIYTKRGLSDCSKLLVLELFNDYNSRISTGILSKARKPTVYSLDFDKLSISLPCSMVCTVYLSLVLIILYI